MQALKSEQIIIKGISGSPGICIGKAYIVDKEGVDLIKRYRITDAQVTKEIDRFKNAVAKAKKDHARIIDSLDEDLGENLNILETHMVLFKDKMLYGKTIDTISNEKINAEWALRRVSRKVKAMFKEIDDKYLKARVNDIVKVSDKIMAYLVGAQDIKI